jgi:hypothetical protein
MWGAGWIQKGDGGNRFIPRAAEGPSTGLQMYGSRTGSPPRPYSGAPGKSVLIPNPSTLVRVRNRTGRAVTSFDRRRHATVYNFLAQRSCLSSLRPVSCRSPGPRRDHP